jgi:hypothetical protein
MTCSPTGRASKGLAIYRGAAKAELDTGGMLKEKEKSSLAMRMNAPSVV